MTAPAPLYIFGKPDALPESGPPRAYAVLVRHPDFPDDAADAAARICGEFRWLPGGTGRYPPRHAIWPLADPGDWLAIRFLDMGDDDIGRPHTVRIEIAFLGGAPKRTWRAALSEAQPGSWPKESCGGDAVGLNSFAGPPLDFDKLTRPSRPEWIDGGDNCQCDLFSLPAAAASRRAAPSAAPVPTSNERIAVPPAATKKAGSVILPVAIAFALGAIVGCVVMWRQYAARVSDFENRLRASELGSRNAAEENRTLRRDLDTKTREFDTMRANLAERDQRLAQYARDARSSLGEEVMSMNRQTRDLCAELSTRIEEMRGQFARLDDIGAKARELKARAEKIAAP